MNLAESLGVLVLTATALNAGVPCGDATAQFAQLGGKLVGSGAVGTLVYQGCRLTYHPTETPHSSEQ